jgi:HPt (histidine-containing phosphotransfer) domain-containing protein
VAAAEPIVVTLSRDMQDLVPLFMTQRKSDLATLTAALPAGNFDAIRRVGHGMAGAGASYGLDHFSDLGERIVAAARAGDTAALDRLRQAFEDYLGRLIVNYL